MPSVEVDARWRRRARGRARATVVMASMESGIHGETSAFFLSLGGRRTGKDMVSFGRKSRSGKLHPTLHNVTLLQRISEPRGFLNDSANPKDVSVSRTVSRAVVKEEVITESAGSNES